MNTKEEAIAKQLLTQIEDTETKSQFQNIQKYESFIRAVTMRIDAETRQKLAS